ncbi:MAG: tetratricopeptide repeat protein, partial [Proteobacteria bacterium]|nr:tetratricopeptide repeat protein [Pseudomonadota bacterium]
MKKLYLLILTLSVMASLTGCVTLPPLMDAAGKGDINAVKALLDKGADANEWYYGTALMQAASRKGNNDVVKLLIDRGADINAMNKGGASALGIAAEYGHTAIVETLIDKGADVDRAINGMEIRQRAVRDYPDIVRKVKDGIKIVKHMNNIHSNKLGLAAFSKKDFDKAVKHFKDYLTHVNDSTGWSNLGWAYMGKGNYDEAIVSFNTAVELNPKNENALQGRGWTYLYKGNFNEAMRDFNKTIEFIKPTDKSNLKESLRGKALSYLGIGDSETAINLIKKAKEASDYDTSSDLSLIYYVIGDKKKAWGYRGGRGMVGATVKDYKKGTVSGVEVVNTTIGGPAEKVGMLRGDVVIRLDSSDITGVMDFVKKARQLIPGTLAKIKILREGVEKELTLQVASAEALMDSHPLIAPFIAKKKGKSKTVVSMPPQGVSPATKSDVDELPAIKAKPNKNAYAIVIGVEKYRQNLPKADYALKDAVVMTEYLEKVFGYPQENIVTLLNDRALKSDLEKYLGKWLPNNVEKDSSVFIYYSGHGAPNPNTGDAYLVPYDGDPSFIEQTGYSLKRLYQNLNKLPAKEIIVVLDSCFSGAGGRSVLAKGARPLVMNIDKQVFHSDRIAILSAAAGNQISSTYEEKGHGLFTYFFLKGIKTG